MHPDHSHQISRRQFTLAVGTSLAAGALPASLFASTCCNDSFFEWKELRPGVHAGFGQGGNAGLIQTSAGGILIDAKNAPYGETLRREADALGKPVSLLINTHHHADHTGGNHAFLTGDSAVGVIMHPKAAPRVEDQIERYVSQMKKARDGLDEVGEEEMPARVRREIQSAGDDADDLTKLNFSPSPAMDETMFRGTDIFLSDITFSLTHVGPGHTDNDIFVFVEKLNLLHAGDLLFHNRHPYMDTSAGTTSAGWIKSCEKMLEICNDETIVIPGHGEITNADGIRQQIRYFESVRAAAAQAISNDTTREDFVKIELPTFKDYGGTRIKERSLGTIYDEMLKEK